MTTETPLSDNEFRLFAQFIYQVMGTNLGANKKQLLAGRLRKRMKALGMTSFREYRELVSSDQGGRELLEMIDAVSTNKTSFFREPAHFDFLAQHVFPTLAKTHQIRIWSAACSSGEEPYSLAIALLEALGDKTSRDIKILATDLSMSMLERGERGIYTHQEAQIPGPLLKKYFLKGTGQSQGRIMVKDSLKRLVHFRYLNLMEPFPMRRPFHVIFCRNVMIYFDKSTQAQLVPRLSRFLMPGGYLFVGHSESLSGIIQSDLVPVAPSVYRKR